MKKYINMLLAIAAFTGLVSCNDDFLDLEPKGSVTEASAFATFETCTDYSLNLYNVFNGPNVNAAAVYFQGPTVNYSATSGRVCSHNTPTATPPFRICMPLKP